MSRKKILDTTHIPFAVSPDQYYLEIVYTEFQHSDIIPITLFLGNEYYKKCWTSEMPDTITKTLSKT